MLPLFLLRRELTKKPNVVSPSDIRSAAESVVMPLERRVDSLELACSAMWELLKDQHGFTDEQLTVKMQELDARDGRIDGEITPESEEKCPSCGRSVLTKRGPKCLWCGADLPRGPFQV